MSRALFAGVVAVALLVAPAGTSAQDEEPLTLKLKAAFLFNFAKFVSWPEAKFAAPTSPIELCVLEPDPFAEILDETVRDKQINNRPLVVRRSPYPEELRGCHLVYSAQTDARALENLFGRLAGAGIMTVHEGAGATRHGVARLFFEGRKMRFEINTLAAESEGLQLSSKLLSVASVVQY